jgi:histidine triad (HIT) family protein
LATDCDFCKIVNGELSARIVYDTPDTIAFFPLEPATTGHTLVIPKEHVPDLWAVDRPLAVKLLDSVLTVSTGLRSALAPEGFNVINSSGRAASQTVFHLHVHLVPRWANDRIGEIWPPPKPWPSETLKDDLAQLVRECIGSLDAPSS